LPVEQTMTQTLQPLSFAPSRPAAEAAEGPVDPMAAARSATLVNAFDALDRAGVPYCVTHGYVDLPDVVSSDVDAVVAPADLAGPAPRTLLDAASGTTLVQWFDDRAVWAVVAGPGVDGVPSLVQLHFSPAFEPDGVQCYPAADVLAGRHRHNGIWAIAGATEFACVLANRVTKESLKDKHTARLSALYAADPAGCERAIHRLWDGLSADNLLDAARTGRWNVIHPMLPQLDQELRKRCRGEGVIGKWGRRIARWIRPTSGLHIVFLGPDGVGKSTVIDAVKASLSPAFLNYSYQTFAPSLIPTPLQPKKETPHQLPPRGMAASWLKAAWWCVCYTAGYYASVRPTVARAGLVLNHRYLPDAIVDPKRYRYSGPSWILRALWRVAPKPDLLFVLDAPAEVIQSRKKEVAPAETARQREGYRAVAQGMPNAHVIRTDRALAEVVGEVNGIVLKHMSARVAKRLGVSEGTP
jgi:thymidylate kinase